MLRPVPQRFLQRHSLALAFVIPEAMRGEQAVPVDQVRILSKCDLDVGQWRGSQRLISLLEVYRIADDEGRASVVPTKQRGFTYCDFNRMPYGRKLMQWWGANFTGPVTAPFPGEVAIVEKAEDQKYYVLVDGEAVLRMPASYAERFAGVVVGTRVKKGEPVGHFSQGTQCEMARYTDEEAGGFVLNSRRHPDIMAWGLAMDDRQTDFAVCYQSIWKNQDWYGRLSQPKISPPIVNLQRLSGLIRQTWSREESFFYAATTAGLPPVLQKALMEWVYSGGPVTADWSGVLSGFVPSEMDNMQRLQIQREYAASEFRVSQPFPVTAELLRPQGSSVKQGELLGHSCPHFTGDYQQFRQQFGPAACWFISRCLHEASKSSPEGESYPQRWVAAMEAFLSRDRPHPPGRMFLDMDVLRPYFDEQYGAAVFVIPTAAGAHLESLQHLSFGGLSFDLLSHHTQVIGLQKPAAAETVDA